MTQSSGFINYTDDAVQVLSSFNHLPWLFLLLHNENLPLKWQIVYCKKKKKNQPEKTNKLTQKPRTAVFEQLVTTVQPRGFPEDRDV